MAPTGLLAGLLLAAQVSPPAALDVPAANAPPSIQPPTADPLVEVQQNDSQQNDAALAARQLVGRSLTPPGEARLVGSPLSLVDALARCGSDRARQLQVARAYWQLAAAVAVYHFRQDETSYLMQLEGFEPASGESSGPTGGEDPDPLRIADAQAAGSAAHVDVLEAQHELARWLDSLPGSALPLPLDHPHVGSYRTYFAQLFPAGAARELARIDLSLPLARQEIALRADCVATAEAGLRAVEQRYVSGQSTRAALLEQLRELAAQRTHFVRAVLVYNDDIAEYALSVASPAAQPANLAAMLVLEPRGLADQGFGAAAVTPAVGLPTAVVVPPNTLPPGATQPPVVSTPPAQSGVVPAGGIERRFGEPTPAAPPREGWQAAEGDADLQSPASGRVDDVPPPDSSILNDVIEVPPLEIQPLDAAPLTPEQAPAAAPDPAALDIETEPVAPDGAAESPGESSAVPPESADAAAESTTLRVPVRAVGESPGGLSPAGSNANSALRRQYRDLATLEPRKRAQRLATWAENHAAEIGTRTASADTPVTQSLTLERLLSVVPPGQREAAVADYWNVWRHAFRCQVLGEHLANLRAVADGTGAVHADVARRIQTLGDQAEADLLAARRELAGARAKLGKRLGGAGTAGLPLVATAPHAGGYALRAERQAPATQQRREFHHLLDVIPAWQTAVADQATAAVNGGWRREAVRSSANGQADPVEVAQTAARHVESAIAFADGVYQYNVAIGRYVQLVAPPSTPLDRYVAALVPRT